MRLLISLSALLLSTLFVQMGIGSLRPFDAISGQALGFSPVEIGLLASGHFAGFLLGCIFGPHLVRRAGHSRAFAVMAGAAVISIIAHPLVPDAMFWTAIRVLSGFSVAGCYTLIESWLQAKVTNDIRGRVFSIYRLVDMSGQIMATAIIATLTPASYISYNLIAIIMCLAILPLALTQSKEPELPEKVSYQPLFALRVSPLAGIGVIVVGFRRRHSVRSPDLCNCCRTGPLADCPVPCRVDRWRHAFAPPAGILPTRCRGGQCCSYSASWPASPARR